jgi:hypothetical protein
MLEETIKDLSSKSRIQTNDIYLAAYLMTQDCRLAEVLRNERRRVSFLVEGVQADILRKHYRRGPVTVNVRFLRKNILTLRRLMDGKQRSTPCPESRMRLSRA